MKLRYKFRLILDETWSYGVLGRTGRGCTESQNVDSSSVDMIIGSLSGPLIAGGGFCASTSEVVEHQRITAAAYTYSAALPAMLATTASETIIMLQEHPELLIGLKENVKTLRQQLDPRSDWVRATSSEENPVQLLVFKSEVVLQKKLSWQDQTMLLQEAVDEVRPNSVAFNSSYTDGAQCLTNGVLITRLKAMPVDPGTTQDKAKQWQPQPALKICVTVGLSKKEIEKAGVTVRHAITKVMKRL